MQAVRQNAHGHSSRGSLYFPSICEYCHIASIFYYVEHYAFEQDRKRIHALLIAVWARASPEYSMRRDMLICDQGPSQYLDIFS